MTATAPTEAGVAERHHPAWKVAVWFVFVRLFLLACMAAFVGIMGVPSRHVGTTLILWLVVIVPVGSDLLWKSRGHVRATMGLRSHRVAATLDIAAGLVAIPSLILLLLFELTTIHD